MDVVGLGPEFEALPDELARGLLEVLEPPGEALLATAEHDALDVRHREVAGVDGDGGLALVVRIEQRLQHCDVLSDCKAFGDHRAFPELAELNELNIDLDPLGDRSTALLPRDEAAEQKQQQQQRPEIIAAVRGCSQLG